MSENKKNTEWLTNTQVSELLGIKYSTLYTYRRRNTIPEPDTYIGRTPVWKRTTIEEWKQNKKESGIELVTDEVTNSQNT
jgi:predicted DNA-binding transcriptional regulator AlpA